jgi:hypothetical protein
MKSKLIASCGMNCMICVAYLREKNKCPGCRNMTSKKYWKKCVIRNCPIIKKNKWKFCSNKCEKYPCQRLRSLDKRYKSKYGMSMIENLNTIKNKGIKKFLKEQEEKYKKAGKILCIHNKKYYSPTSS